MQSWLAQSSGQEQIAYVSIVIPPTPKKMPLLFVPNYLQGSALSNTGLMSYLPNYLQGYALLKKIRWINLLRCVKQLLQLTVQVLTSYLPIRHYQKQASPKCHYGNGLRHYAIFSSSALHQTFRPLIKSRRQQPITMKKTCSSRTC
jgi:hypothetical protein